MKDTLKITSKGQVTLRRAVLDQLGVRPGDRITVEIVAPGRVEVRPARAGASLEAFVGCLKKPGRRAFRSRRSARSRARAGRAGGGITADTNVLVRAAVMDEPAQSRLAAAALLEAERVAVTLPTLCEFVWVLTRGYKRKAAEVAAAMRKLAESERVLVDRPALEAGLAVLEGAAISRTASSLLKGGGQAAEFSRASTRTPSN